MASKPPGSIFAENQRLASEVEELRLRLEEAEQALEAIRTGQADSLIVEGPDGTRVFSLEGADHSYRILVEAMNEGAATLGEDGAILYCNQRFAEMLGAPIERVMGSAFLEFLPERSREAFEALVREAHGGESRGEMGLLGRAGEVVPAYVSVSVIHGEGSRRLCLLITDLRAQKRNQEILAAEQLARSVIDQAAEAIVVCDEDGRIIRASAAAARLGGTNPLLRMFDEVFALELSPQAGQLSNLREFHESSVVGAVLRGGEAHAAPAVLRRPDGSEAHVLMSATSLRGDGNRVRGCVMNLVDVTDSMHAVENMKLALAEAESARLLLDAIMENVPEGIVVADAPDVRIRKVSRYAQMLTGKPLETIGGISVDEHVQKWDIFKADGVTVARNEDLPLTRATQNGEVVVDEEWALGNSSGTRIPILCNASPIRDFAGAIVGGIIAWRDITERKRAEDALKQANFQLAEADRRKTEFLAMLSHELRNPLAPIANSLAILDHAPPGSVPAERAKQVIGRQVTHLSNLVNDLLDITRITHNKVQLQKERLELNALVRRGVEDNRSLFEQAGVRLKLLPDAHPVPVFADATRIAQIVGNLLQNSAKFTNHGGQTRVSVAVEGGEAVVRVADDGVGMSPETLDRLFHPFAQVEQTLDRSKGGLGLGLALIKGLVELHGGSVSARSDGLGRGVEMIVRLPLDSRAELEAAAPQTQLLSCRRRVLIIEDNTDAADTLGEILEFNGHEVAVAYHGADGVAKALEFRPDVVLCDIGLPGMDGYDVARTFRSNEALKKTYLVALSGYGLPKDLQLAQQAGFDRHLVKPPNLDKLNALLAGMPLSLSASGPC